MPEKSMPFFMVQACTELGFRPLVNQQSLFHPHRSCGSLRLQNLCRMCSVILLRIRFASSNCQAATTALRCQCEGIRWQWHPANSVRSAALDSRLTMYQLWSRWVGYWEVADLSAQDTWFEVVIITLCSWWSRLSFWDAEVTQRVGT